MLPCHVTDVWDVEKWTTARSSLLGCHFWKIRRWIQTFYDRRKERERTAKCFAQLLGKRQRQHRGRCWSQRDNETLYFSFQKESALKDEDTAGGLKACRG